MTDHGPARIRGGARCCCGLAALLGAAVAGLAALALRAQDAPPSRLFEQSPFAVIVLADKDRTQQRVLPFTLPDDPQEPLRVRLVDAPERLYEIARRDVAEVRSFGQLVLAEAEGLVREGQLDQAYDYYEFLQRDDPKLPGLEKSLADYLLADARALLANGRVALAAAVLDELHRRQARHPGLEAALGEATDKLVEEHFRQGDLPAARRLLDALARKFPEHAVLAAWKARFAAEARTSLDAARTAAAQEDWADAQSAAAAAVRLDPALAPARALAEEAWRRYPRVVVGVGPEGATPWTMRRQDRLRHRRLVEFSGPGPEGGQYACPIGALSKEDLDRRLVFRLAEGGSLTGYDLARELSGAARPAAPRYDPHWAAVAGVLEVRGVYELHIDLRRPHLKPEALLGLELAGPYEGEGRFLLRPGALGAGASTPREIVERRFPTAEAAVAALERGDIDVLDRLPPWQAPRLRTRSDLAVVGYAVPTIHCLVPNLERPFTARRGFRRALEYGLDRQRILSRDLLRGASEPGCEVASGPFPSGRGFDDPLRYAFNEQVKPRPYEPRLAMTLAAVALAEVQAAAKAQGRDVDSIPPLVLAHPPHDVARTACQAIQRQLAPLGITIQLREAEDGPPLPPRGDVDLAYAELWVGEPLADAQRLFSPHGPLGGASPYVQLALLQLEAADGWQAARARLQQIHQLAHDESAVIPLWQLIEHAAHSRTVEGLGQRPVTLYQHVESWRVSPRLPAESRAARSP